MAYKRQEAGEGRGAQGEGLKWPRNLRMYFNEMDTKLTIFGAQVSIVGATWNNQFNFVNYSSLLQKRFQQNQIPRQAVISANQTKSNKCKFLSLAAEEWARQNRTIYIFCYWHGMGFISCIFLFQNTRKRLVRIVFSFLQSPVSNQLACTWSDSR